MATKEKLQEHSNQRAHVLEYLTDNPRSLTDDIAEGTGITKHSVGVALNSLKLSGFVARERIPGIAKCYWTAIDTDAPIRPVVTSWPPHLVRHWLDVAMYGPAPAQVAA